MIDFIKRPYLTDKTLAMIEKDKYTFEVDAKLTKNQMKKFIEEVFNVKVKKINTHIPPRKQKKVGAYAGTARRQKRAIVTLQKGDSIDIF